ncbi:MAG: M18 family aminopeptidase [Spirochaetales bacterium]|nr:M18 family aminopeptidase [Spirochaetales bacterium]
MDQKYIESTLELMDFIQDSPSCYHVVANAATMLENAGAKRLDEKEKFDIEAGHCYFTVRNSSSLIAFRMPEGRPTGYSIVAAHTDSPSFKIKENPEISTGDLYATLNVEAYGGMLMAPWFDRPLSIAGRAFVKEKEGRISERLVNFDKDLCQIVNLCIHQNRDANKGYEYKVQKDMLPIIGLGKQTGAIRSLVAELLDVKEDRVLDTELFLYNRMGGSIWGLDDEFFSCPKIDDLQCAFSALKAFVTAEDSSSSKIQVVALFDNEEVGSSTKQGANSDFLRQVAHRIGCAMGWDFDTRCALQSASFMLSADNGHSLHPNYPEKCDPTNRPVINGGVLIKYAGNQKYTTDAYSGSFLKSILSDAGIPYQVFFNNSNVTGGSTLGNISTTQFSIPTVDIGAAQLAMHSPYETAGTMDTFNLTEGMKAFYRA